MTAVIFIAMPDKQSSLRGSFKMCSRKEKIIEEPERKIQSVRNNSGNGADEFHNLGFMTSQ